MAMPCGPTLSVAHPGCWGVVVVVVVVRGTVEVVVVVVRGTGEVVVAMMEGNAELPGECRDAPPVASWLPDEQPASKAATPVTTSAALLIRFRGRGHFILGIHSRGLNREPRRAAHRSVERDDYGVIA